MSLFDTDWAIALLATGPKQDEIDLVLNFAQSDTYESGGYFWHRALLAVDIARIGTIGARSLQRMRPSRRRILIGGFCFFGKHDAQGEGLDDSNLSDQIGLATIGWLWFIVWIALLLV